MSSIKIAVLAGTPIDTQMGVQCLADAGLSGFAFPLASDPREQTTFQISSQEEKLFRVRKVLSDSMEQGCSRVFVFCNSLSSVVDFPSLAKETGMRIVTPLDVYRELASKYSCLALIAANAQGLSGIERTMVSVNPNLDLLSVGILPAVLSVEAGEAPPALVERHHLAELAAWFQQCGAEALVLGCTHFPYFKDALAARCALPLIDPSAEMLRMIQE